MLANPSP